MILKKFIGRVSDWIIVKCVVVCEFIEGVFEIGSYVVFGCLWVIICWEYIIVIEIVE